VEDLTLAVPEGAVFALLGPNGAGKTTTIKMLMNILRPTLGDAAVLGVPSRRVTPTERAQIGYVSENQALPDWMTVGQLIAFCRPLYPTWDDDFAARLIAQFDLPVSTRLRDLSRGMRVKASLLSSLAYRPRRARRARSRRVHPRHPRAVRAGALDGVRLVTRHRRGRATRRGDSGARGDDRSRRARLRHRPRARPADDLTRAAQNFPFWTVVVALAPLPGTGAPPASVPSAARPRLVVEWKLPACFVAGSSRKFGLDVCKEGGDATLVTSGSFAGYPTGGGKHALASGQCLSFGAGDEATVESRHVANGTVCISNTSTLINAHGRDHYSERKCVPAKTAADCYLDKALAVVEENFRFVERIDWTRVHARRRCDTVSPDGELHGSHRLLVRRADPPGRVCDDSPRRDPTAATSWLSHQPACRR